MTDGDLSPRGNQLHPAAGARQYTLRVDLPGVAREQIMVAMAPGYVEIHGCARAEELRKTSGRRCRVVREFTTRHRVPVPDDADLEHARVTLVDAKAIIEIPLRTGAG